jgi:hypothetical protein
MLAFFYQKKSNRNSAIYVLLVKKHEKKLQK